MVKLMKLLRYGPAGAEKPGLLDGDGVIRSLESEIGDIDGATLSPQSIARLRGIDPSSLPEIARETRLGPPVADVGNFIGIGLNYRDHAAETGSAVPAEPVVFFKSRTSIVGPNDDTTIPRGATKMDYEAELGIVIGTGGTYIDEDAALEHVAGYTIVNDVSEREFQFDRNGTWDKGKAFDTFGPVGPWVVTADEIQDVQALPIWLEVNGRIRQDSSTAQMIFSVAKIVSYVSNFLTLHAGDVIATGTPAGVAVGMKPEPQWLQKGDVVRLGIDGLGEQRQQLVGWDSTVAKGV
jgi:2-keto-4-pentenoate hydratase/2-oxohepta-3-ene-1,7-dioic acid hydratase in catechol pathway